MQFDKNLNTKFTVEIHKEADENTLEIKIKQKDVTASELNAHIIKFAEEDLLDDLDSNSIQLVTEELVVMILLQMVPAGTVLQYFITHNRAQGVIKLGIGYPGESYNPFEQEDNIFMINIFREWISDIQFKHEKDFNELILTINEAAKELPEERNQTGEKEPSAAKDASTASEEVFDFGDYRPEDNTVAAGSVASNRKSGRADSLELMIRDKGLNALKIYQYLDSYLKEIHMTDETVIFDDVIPSTAEDAVKSVGKALIMDVLEQQNKDFSYIAFRINYCINNREIVLRMRYPGSVYNPLMNAENRGIKVMNRQASILAFHACKNKMNELIAILKLEK